MDSVIVAEEIVDLIDLQARIDELLPFMNHAMATGNMDAWHEFDSRHRRLCERRNYLAVKLKSHRYEKTDFDFTGSASVVLRKMAKRAEVSLSSRKNTIRNLTTKIEKLQRVLDEKLMIVNIESAKLSAIRDQLAANERDEV